MSDLIWKPEPKRLAKAREIICGVPERLMEILEHDYDQSCDGPGEPLEVRYHHCNAEHYHSSGFPMKGAAWQHLTRNPPIMVVERDGEVERFKPVFEEKYNPYRKTHTLNYWAWYVLRWELIPPPEEQPKYPEHEKLKAISADSQKIGDFINWLGANELSICGCRETHSGVDWTPTIKPIRIILAEYFDIDQEKIDDEKDEMLKEMREENQGEA